MKDKVKVQFGSELPSYNHPPVVGDTITMNGIVFECTKTVAKEDFIRFNLYIEPIK